MTRVIKRVQRPDLSASIDSAVHGMPLHSVAILCHGLGLSKRQPLIVSLAKQLNRKGIATIRFDFSAHGRSQGVIKDRTVAHFLADLQSVTEWVRSESAYTNQPLIAIGHSIGALAVLIASSRKTTIDAAIMIGCNADSSKLYESYMRRKRIHVYKNYIQIGETKVASNFLADRQKWEPRKFVPRITIPKLYICGDNDKTNPPSESRDLYTWSRSPRAIKILHGPDHYFMKTTEQAQLNKAISQWLKKRKLSL